MRNNYAERSVPKSTAAVPERPPSPVKARLAAVTAANDPRPAAVLKPGLY
jgi:hypothetical protein